MSDKIKVNEQVMDEQAKRIAISFADYAGNNFTKSDDVWGTIVGKKRIAYTTQQLYDKFLFEVMARIEEYI